MDWKKTAAFLTLVLCLCLFSVGCAFAEGTAFGAIDMAKWSYNADDDVYYQVGIPYCASPADESYETLAVFVPGQPLGQHQGRVVAEGAAEIAAAGKDGAGHHAGIVQQGQFLQTGYQHRVSP